MVARLRWMDPGRRLRIVLAVSLLALLAVLASRARPEHANPPVPESSGARERPIRIVDGRDDVVSAVRARGVPVPDPAVEATCADPFVPTRGGRYRLRSPDAQGGGESLCIYSFSDATTAHATAARVPPSADGGATDWITDVRYFRCGAVIAQYLGSDERKVRLLTGLCGAPFASAKQVI